MTNQIPSLEALKLISNKLKKAEIPHVLGGTGLLFALGLVTEVKDWDIMTDATFEMIQPLLVGLKWERVGQSEDFCSDYFLKIYLEGSLVELIGGFSIRTKDNVVHRVPVEVSTLGEDVPLADPQTWLNAYRLMGRPHRAQVLEEFLKN